MGVKEVGTGLALLPSLLDVPVLPPSDQEDHYLCTTAGKMGAREPRSRFCSTINVLYKILLFKENVVR